MKSTLRVFTCMFFCVASFGAERIPGADIKAERIVAAANDWQQGREIPEELFAFAHSWFSDIEINPLGTGILFARIDNYQLIKNIALRTNVDQRVWEVVVERALRLVGPTKFLTDARSNSVAPLRLKQQTLVRHVAGKSLIVQFSDIEEKKAREVISEISDELGRGKPFDEVLVNYQRKYPSTGGRTKIGTGVEFVLAENKDALFSFPTEYIPKEHIAELVRATRGAALILPYKEDPERFDVKGDGRGLVLYQIEEVYVPFKAL